MQIGLNLGNIVLWYASEHVHTFLATRPYYSYDSELSRTSVRRRLAETRMREDPYSRVEVVNDNSVYAGRV